MFKGTATRSAEAIARAIDSVGGQMDAFTAKEHTCFYVSVLDDHLALAVDLLTDILMHPLFAAPDIEKEKAVVFQEIKMVEDTADDLVHDLFAERFWAGHPLGRPILGRWDVVRDFGRDVHPAPLRGGVRAGPDRRRGGGPPGARARRGSVRRALQRVPAPGRHAGDRRRPRCTRACTSSRSLWSRCTWWSGFPGIAETAPERYALYLLNDVLGGSMSSRLFQEVRERQALAYSIHSGAQSYRDTGLFYIYAGTDAANFAKVVTALMKELRALKKDGVTAEELARAKDHLKGSLMLSLESTSSRMNRVAKQELRFGSFFSLDEMLGAIDTVRPEEVEALAWRILDEQQLSLLTLGPIDRRNLPRELAIP